MNTRNLATATVVGIFVVAALISIIPAMATSLAAPQNTLSQQSPSSAKSLPMQRVQLSVGHSITFTSVAGGFRQVGDKSVNGTATGSLSLSVTGVFSRGYTLSVSAGTVAFNEVTYSISGGSAELGPYGVLMVGQAQAGAAQILFGGRPVGRFGNTSYAILRLDLKDGSNEFFIRLLVTISK
jgi:hypothetical protein